MEMKRIFSALIPFLLLAVVAAAQGLDNSTLPISKLDQLQRHRGTALAIDYLQEEKITPISFFSEIVRDMRTGEIQGGIRISGFKTVGGVATIQTFNIDYEEIDSCIKVLLLAKEQFQREKPKFYTLRAYRTIDGSEIGAYYGGGFWGPKWSIYFKTNTTLNSWDGITLGSEKIEDVLGIFYRSKYLLKDKLGLKDISNKQQ